jgi:two-component system chemotaxis response regulator CheY
MSWRILITDDSAIVRAMVRKALGICGVAVAEVHEAANGREALEVLARATIDVVFADVNMPEMDGPELVARMRADAALAAIPVVMVTSERNEARLEALRSHGVRAVLSKPFRPEALRDVASALGAPREGRHA